MRSEPHPSPRPTRRRRTLGLLAAVGASVAVGSVTGTAPAEAAGAPLSGYALTTGHEIGRQTVPGYAPGGRPVVQNLGNAESLIYFPGLTGDHPVPHVRSVDGGHCQTFEGLLIAEPGAQLLVKCFDLAGNPVPHGYAISVHTGGNTVGGLVTSLNGSITTAGVKVPPIQTSSIGGTVTVQRLAKGKYRYALPKLPGSGPAAVAVTPLGKSMALCGVTGKASVAGGAVAQIDVSCIGPLNSGPRDTGLQISYSKGGNILGDGGLSTAYASVAKSTAASRTLTASEALNHYGRTSSPLTSNGTTKVVRKGVGRYVVQLGKQASGFMADHTATVTATGGIAECQVLDSSAPVGIDRQDLSISCQNNVGQLVDTAYDLTFSRPQP